VSSANRKRCFKQFAVAGTLPLDRVELAPKLDCLAVAHTFLVLSLEGREVREVEFGDEFAPVPTVCIQTVPGVQPFVTQSLLTSSASLIPSFQPSIVFG
jgi:hypothetical protein